MQEELEKIIKEVESVHDAENERYGPEQRGNEVPEDLREQQDRLQRRQETIA